MRQNIWHWALTPIELLVWIAGLSLCQCNCPATDFPGGFSTTGAWKFSSTLPGYAADKNSLYSTDPNATAIWNPDIHSVGPLRLSLFLVTHDGNDQNAQVEIIHAGKTNFVSVNLVAGQPRWLALGKFEFAGTGDEFIRVAHGSPGTLRVSALKVEIIDAKAGSVWQTLVFDDLMPSNPVVMQKSAPAHLRDGPPNPGDWLLTFSDDFNGDHLDTNVWQCAQGETRGVLQSARFPENVVVTNGWLRLVTRHEKRGGKEWTTAMVTTRVFHQKYGYWEARYRYAPASGLNQAFWMIKPGVKGSDGGFEIDVNEGHYPNEVNTTLLQDGMNSQSQSYRAGYDLSADFHLYAAEWTEQEVIYYFDGKPIYRVPNTRGQLDCPVIFSTAVLLWAGPIKNSLDGASMDVDWVRVYQRKKT
jgi:hypothetical protein